MTELGRRGRYAKMIWNHVETLEAAGNLAMILNYVETLEAVGNPTIIWNDVETLVTLLVCI